MSDIDNFNTEFTRFLNENFSPEKQATIFEFIRGWIKVSDSSKKLSNEEIDLVFAKLKILLL
jgi:hypothetical protein